MKKIFLILVLFSTINTVTLYAQYDPVKFNFGRYTLESKFDSANYCSNLIVYKGSLLISTRICTDLVYDINAFDFNGDGSKELVIQYYSGGAHCCFSINLCRIQNDNFEVLDSLFLGNAGYEVKDIDNDGEIELVTANDMFAYAFTNYAQSRFSILIYQLENNKLQIVNNKFEKEVLNHIKELQDELKEYIKNGFECPKSADEETFNTDAGAVQAILAPIAADYYSIGMVDKGYQLINKVYTCPGKDRFIQILKQDFKLK